MEELSEETKEEALNYFTENLHQIKEMLVDDPESINPHQSPNFIEEQSLKIEDEVFLKFGIKY